MANDEKLFRKEVLDRLASPEQLNTIMQVTDARIWLALLGCALVVATAILWGIFGSVPNRVHGSGILIHSAGLADVVSTGNGQIIGLEVEVGDQIRKGDAIARVAQPELVAQIEALRASVVELRVGLEKSRRLGTQDEQLRQSVSSSERVSLSGAIAATRMQERELEQRVLTQQELLKKGLVTQESVLALRQQLRTAQNSVQQLQAELQRSSADVFTIQRANQTSIQADTLRIQETERQIGLLMERLKSQSTIVSPHAGRVVELRATVGDVLAPGTAIVSLERTADKGSLEALLYVDSKLGKRVQPGMRVKLSPSVVKRERHGVLIGEITAVEGFASTRLGMMRVLHNESLVEAFLADTAAAPMALRAKLERDDRTPSGYRWSSGTGPDLMLTSGTRLDADITTSTQHPIALVFTVLNSLD
jgi:HlyD family secretion protein